MRRLALCALASVAACAATPGRPAVFPAPQVIDRGISIPLPPPSLHDAPEQTVDVEGLVPEEALGLDAEVFVEDRHGGAITSAVPDAAGSFVASALDIDVSQACLRAWLEVDGEMGEPADYRVLINDDAQSVRAEPVTDCDAL